MACKIVRLQEVGKLAKHHIAIHMVAIEKAVGVREVGGVAVVQENASREGEVSIDVGIDVLHIVLALHHRIVDVGIVQGEPGADVGAQGSQVREASGVVAGLGGLEVEERLIHPGLVVDSPGVPQGEGGKGQNEEQEEPHHGGEQAVGAPRQGSRRLQGRDAEGIAAISMFHGSGWSRPRGDYSRVRRRRVAKRTTRPTTTTAPRIR